MPDPRPPSLLFLATEDWFFASHFLPMVRAARAEGFDVCVATRFVAHREVIAATGARLIELDMERGEGRALSPMRALRRIRRVLRDERPDIVHAISLRAILLGGVARRLAGGRSSLVHAVTGLGILGADKGWRGRIGRGAIRLLIRGALEPRGTSYLFENEEDARWLRLDGTGARVAFVGGAGVDPALYPETPLPEGKTLRVALVARMLWSKGIDIAVEAVTLARRNNLDVTLSLYGAPDPANPRAIPEAQLIRWSEREGVEWLGHTGDVAAVWRGHHVACLPSRGGEGLPRSLLEAACCGRPVIATDVPGCSLLVRSGREGLLVPPDDAPALAAALERLAADRDLAAAMGAAAARRVRDGFTEADVEASVRALYRRILSR